MFASASRALKAADPFHSTCPRAPTQGQMVAGSCATLGLVPPGDRWPCRWALLRDARATRATYHYDLARTLCRAYHLPRAER